MGQAIMKTWTNRLRGFFVRPGTRVREELRKEPEELVASNIRKAKPTGEEPKKKNREWLEKFYYMEPLLFSGINFFVHQVVGPGFEIQAKSVKEQALCQSFADKVDLQSILEKVQLDLGIFGNCLSPDTLIVTNPDFRPISQIEEGTSVLTLDGSFKRVIGKAVRDFEGELLEISTCGSSAYPLRITGNHYLPVIPKSKAKSYRNRRTLSKQRTKHYLKGQIYEESPIEWKPASSLEEGDLLFYPIRQKTSTLEFLNFYDWTQKAKSNFRHKSLDNLERLPLNEDFMRLAGLYLAEGSAPQKGGQMTFSLSIKEINLENSIREAIEGLFGSEIKVSTYLSFKTHTRRVVVNSKVIKEFFASNFGRRASEKKIPSYILSLPTYKQRMLLDFYLKGDGYFIKNKNRWRAETKSKSLVLQLRAICLRLGFKPCLYESRGMFILDFGLRTTFDSGFLDKRLCLSPIKKIRKISYKGPVYDLCVEGNHTFTTASCVVHNSFVEKLRNANGELVGVVGIDTKSMQFMKGLGNKLLLNDLGQPIGYIQEHPLESDKESYDGILTRSGVDPKKGNYVGGIPFGKEEIVHFRLYSLSDTIMGVGLVEPLFDTVLLKMEAEEALGKGLKRVGQPLLVATLGLPEVHEPNPKEIKGFSDSVMANVGEMKDITLPYYYKLGKLEVNIGQLKEYLDHFSYLIASGLGIPHSILLAGERIGSKVADIQADNVVRIIKSYQKNLARTVEREIFKPLIKEAGLKEVPKLVFKTVSPALLRARMERIADASRAGLITPDKNLEEFIRKEEDLPPIGEESEEQSKLREQFRRKKFSDSKGAARKPKEGDGNT